jgi:hypothetical protein
MLRNGTVKRHHCRKCKKAVCDTCFTSLKRISKGDPKIYNICEKCDFNIANP